MLGPGADVHGEPLPSGRVGPSLALELLGEGPCGEPPGDGLRPGRAVGGWGFQPVGAAGGEVPQAALRPPAEQPPPRIRPPAVAPAARTDRGTPASSGRT